MPLVSIAYFEFTKINKDAIWYPYQVHTNILVIYSEEKELWMGFRLVLKQRKERKLKVKA